MTNNKVARVAFHPFPKGKGFQAPGLTGKNGDAVSVTEAGWFLSRPL